MLYASGGDDALQLAPGARVLVWMCACVRACVRVCVRACVCVCVSARMVIFQVILDDVKLLNIKPDIFTCTSDHFDVILDYARKLIKVSVNPYTKFSLRPLFSGREESEGEE